MGLATTILRNKRLTIGVITVAIGALYAYGAWMPDSLSRQYIARLKPLVTDIQTAFRQVEAGLGRQIFMTPSMPLDDKLRDLDAINEINNNARQKLDAMAKVIPELQKPPPGTGFIGAYSDAAATQTQAFAILLQSRDVLGNYDKLIGFLRAYYQNQAQVEAELNDIHSIADTNLLSGQYGVLYQTANKVYACAAEIKNAPAPNELKDFQTQAVQHFDDVAQGFEQLAYGISIGPNTQQTYAGMEMLEKAALDHAELNNTLFSLVDNSATLRSVDDLPAKAESLIE